MCISSIISASLLAFQADNIILKERKLNIAPAIKKQVRGGGGLIEWKSWCL